WRPKPEPGTVQQDQRAGVTSPKPEAAKCSTTGAAAALLLTPAQAADRSTAKISSDFGFISSSNGYRLRRSEAVLQSRERRLWRIVFTDDGADMFASQHRFQQLWLQSV